MSIESNIEAQSRTVMAGIDQTHAAKMAAMGSELCKRMNAASAQALVIAADRLWRAERHVIEARVLASLRELNA